MNAAPFYDACVGQDNPRVTQPDYGQIPPVNLILACGFLTVGLFSLALSFTISGVPLSHGQPVTPTAISRMSNAVNGHCGGTGHRRSADTARFSTACSRPFMAIHPPFSDAVNGRRHATPKPEMTASAIIVEIRSIQKFSSPMVSVSPRRAAAHHQSGQTGTGWSLQRAPLSGIADIFRVIKNTTYYCADCSPDVMVADVPMYPRIVSSRGQWQHRTGYRNQPQRLPLCILARPRSVISAATPAETRNPFPEAQMPQVHPAWREVHQ